MRSGPWVDLVVADASAVAPDASHIISHAKLSISVHSCPPLPCPPDVQCHRDSPTKGDPHDPAADHPAAAPPHAGARKTRLPSRRTHPAFLERGRALQD